MATINLLYEKQYAINDKIHIVIPTVGQILGDEDGYYGLVSALTAMPIDYMVQLEDAGIDFTSINEYELFLLIFSGLKTQDTSLVFGDLDLSNFNIAVNEQNGLVVLLDKDNDIVIDRAIHGQIASVLRKIHNLERNNKKPANIEAKEFMLKRAREKMRRRKRNQESQLESLIIAMVCTEQWKYDFEGTRELSIYQFNEGVRQVIRKVDYDNRMYGVYTGSISVKDLSQDDLNWLSHK
ncbi:MAG: hypothetical protein J6Y20_14495 [Lachnospiraceae bacterium]|nr:hypothetical protein [Lachnospiraceae bacterium]